MNPSNSTPTPPTSTATPTSLPTSSSNGQRTSSQASEQQLALNISSNDNGALTTVAPTTNIVAPSFRPTGPVRAPQLDQYLVLLPTNPRQPGVSSAYRVPLQAAMMNQPNILQQNLALRGINASPFIRGQTSSSGVMQTSTSQVQTTTMANIQGRHVQIPFGTAGPRGQITLANGQTIMQSPIPIQRHQYLSPRATILQQPTVIRGVPPNIGVHSVIPSSQTIGIGAPSSISTTPIIHRTNFMTNTALAPSQMTPDDVLTKGVSFFNSLMNKIQVKSKKTIQNLIQALIDGKKTSEEFATALQKETNSGPQLQLVPFLDMLMPHMRHALSTGSIKLNGIKPPLVPQGSSQPDESAPSTSSPNKTQSNTTPAKKKKVPLPPGQKSAYALKKEAREAKRKEREAAQGIVKVEKSDEKKETEKPEKPMKPKADKPKRQEKQKKQEKQLESLSSTLRDDDDVNDVAAMGGVNLAEESQRIMASGAELVGTQIRSCKDEPFLDTKALSIRIARIAKEYNLSEPSKEVVTIISHATQERLKNMVERLGMLAEHRNENLARNPKYEVSTDIKGQIKFLADLDRIEKRRYEEQERELLLRVAKSRSKVEDPEQQKLRQKAKDMQRAEQEEVRQREANETALLAIGPRKKLKTPVSNSNDMKINVDSIASMPRGDTRRPTKRVNMKDLQVLMELDRSLLNRLIKIL